MNLERSLRDKAIKLFIVKGKRSWFNFPFFFLFFLFCSNNLFSQHFEWVRQFESNENAKVVSIKSDEDGNIYYVGYFYETLTYNEGPDFIEIPTHGIDDIFMVKTTNSGSLLWLKTIGGEGNDRPNNVYLSELGQLYITGYFEDEVDFDPNDDEFLIMTDGGGSNSDIFVLCLSTMGEFIWANGMGGFSPDQGVDLVADSESNLYLCGVFQDSANLNIGEDTLMLYSNGQTDIFITCFDSSGEFDWVKSYGGVGGDLARSITIDDEGNLYTAGYFDGMVDFDPSEDVWELEAMGYYNFFIQKMDGEGNFIKAIAGSPSANHNLINDILYDDEGNLYVTGFFGGTVDFDPSDDELLLTANGIRDVFVVKYDTTMNIIWGNVLSGSDNYSGGNAIAIDADNFIYVTGSFEGIVDFDSDVDETEFKEAEDRNIFILKLNEFGNFIWVNVIGDDQPSEGAAIAVDMDGSVYVGGLFEGEVDFDPDLEMHNIESLGMSDAYVLKLSECGIVTLSDSIISCNSYTMPSGDETYFASGTYSDTILNDAGCDLLITTYLTIIESTENDLFIESCESFTVPSGDETYTSSGVYSDTLINLAGCDSVITIELEIVSLEANILRIGDELTTSILDADYQWIDCDNLFLPIDGETDQSFFPSEEGNYAVIVANDPCIDTSDCMSFSNVGINNNTSVTLKVSPNPFNDFTTITFAQPLTEYHILLITNILGEEVFRNENVTGSSLEIKKEQLGVGIYILTLFNSNSEQLLSTKLLVE